MADLTEIESRLEQAIQACVPEESVVTGYVVVVEYADAEARFIDLIQSDGMTPWLRDGLLNAAQGWEDND